LEGVGLFTRGITAGDQHYFYSFFIFNMSAVDKTFDKTVWQRPINF
jgi:hypothetical protein